MSRCEKYKSAKIFFKRNFFHLFSLFSYHFMLPSPFYVTLDVNRTGPKAFLPDDDDENESSIRRACSLSDLSMGKGNKLQLFFGIFCASTEAASLLVSFCLAHDFMTSCDVFEMFSLLFYCE